MSDYIPDEILNKILLLLPPKSLVRFCCVSKSWKSHITSSDFIHAQLNSTKGGNHHNLLLLKYDVAEPKNEQYSLHVDNNDSNLELYKNLDCPFLTPDFRYFCVLGSVNGLLCLRVDRLGKNHNLFFWNPSISTHVRLPCPRFTYSTHGPYDDVIGFGFDLLNNDYKVVRLFFKDCDGPPFVEVFKLSTGSWETIAATIGDDYFVLSDRESACLNGVVYWIAYKMNVKTYVILSFHLTSEVFNEILLPPGRDNVQDKLELHVGVYCECLSLICYSKPYLLSFELFLKEIWVMKDGSWRKIYTIDSPGTTGKTIGFTKNGDFLRTIKNGQLVSYDASTKKTKYFDIFEYTPTDSDYHKSHFYAGAYEESLVLLGYGQRSGKETLIQARNWKMEKMTNM